MNMFFLVFFWGVGRTHLMTLCTLLSGLAPVSFPSLVRYVQTTRHGTGWAYSGLG